jgi:hypothetical protein
LLFISSFKSRLTCAAFARPALDSRRARPAAFPAAALSAVSPAYKARESRPAAADTEGSGGQRSGGTTPAGRLPRARPPGTKGAYDSSIISSFSYLDQAFVVGNVFARYRLYLAVRGLRAKQAAQRGAGYHLGKAALSLTIAAFAARPVR